MKYRNYKQGIEPATQEKTMSPPIFETLENLLTQKKNHSTPTVTTEKAQQTAIAANNEETSFLFDLYKKTTRKRINHGNT